MLFSLRESPSLGSPAIKQDLEKRQSLSEIAVLVASSPTHTADDSGRLDN